MINIIKTVRSNLREIHCAFENVNLESDKLVKNLQCNGVVLDKLELQPIRRASDAMSNLAVPGGSLEKYLGFRKK